MTQPQAQPFPQSSKFCPEIPPLIKPPALVGAAAQMEFFPCMGPVCAKWDACQGPNSPGQREARATARVYAICDGLEAVAVSAPFGLGTALKAAAQAVRMAFLPASGSAS